MIRPANLSTAAALAQPAISSPRAPFDARVRDMGSWFRSDAPMGALRISGDLSPSARGLSVEQHAAAVLVHLRGDPDEPA